MGQGAGWSLVYPRLSLIFGRNVKGMLELRNPGKPRVKVLTKWETKSTTASGRGCVGGRCVSERKELTVLQG